MKELDKEHGFFNEKYTLEDFKADLRKHGVIGDRPGKGKGPGLTAKGEKLIRERALDQVFGKLKKSDRGSHALRRTGPGDEPTSDRRSFRFGDPIEQVAMSDSIRNAQQRGIDDLRLSEDDLEVIETEHQSACATVLMLDISHSMILYGEDRITPAKKVAMALATAINRFLDDPDFAERCGAAAHTRAMDFSAQHYAMRLVDAVRELALGEDP